jgi:hypothetical protein
MPHIQMAGDIRPQPCSKRKNSFARLPQFCIMFSAIGGPAGASVRQLRLRDTSASARGTFSMHRNLVVAVLGLSALLWASRVAASPIEELIGYWTGAGSVTLANGNIERVKCAVTYRVSDGGSQIRQSMRCASADYSINASAELKVKGAQVSGNWEEKTYSAVGQVSGRYNGDGFSLSIQGANFTAAMTLSLSSCKQSISIHPEGLEVKRISIALGKC